MRMGQTESLDVAIRMATCKKRTGNLEYDIRGVSQTIWQDFRFSGQPEVFLEFLPIKL